MEKFNKKGLHISVWQAFNISYVNMTHCPSGFPLGKNDGGDVQLFYSFSLTLISTNV